MGWTCSMQKADECAQYIRKKNFGRDSWFPSRHETQDVQRMLYAASQYSPLPTLRSFAQQNSFCYIPCRPVRTLRIYPPSRLTPNVRLFLQSLPLLRRQPAVSTSGRLEYYDVVWGLTKVHLKDKGLVVVSRFRRRYLVEVRNLNDRVSDIQRCQNCLSYGLLWHICAFIV